jgi:hypothetical protein
MTTAADTAAEKAFEAALSGGPVPEKAAYLAGFTEAVRATATHPGRPNPALAELLSTGLLIDQPDPSPGAARRRRRPVTLLSALIAKIAAAGAVAQAAAGTGVVVVGLSTAGFVGVLPGSAQHTFATVVDSVTPLEAPDPATTSDTSTDQTTPSADDTSDTGTSGADGTEAPAHPSTFGGRVSDAAHNGGVDGRQVSQWAHERNQERKSGTATPSSSPSPSAEPSASADDSTSTGTPARVTGTSTGGSPHGTSGHGKPGH